MDKEFHQSQWFVYMGDHHEGPFSLAEIQSRMDQGVLSRDSYVWKEGMADWAPMTHLEDFKPLFVAKPKATPIPDFENQGSVHQEPKFEFGGAPQETSPVEPPVHDTPSVQEAPTAEIPESFVSSPETLPDPVKKSGSKKALIAIVLGLTCGLVLSVSLGWLQPVSAVFGDIARPLILRLSDWIPAVARLVSPIPAMSDVEPEEYLELQRAAVQSNHITAVARSTADLFSPTFYVVAQVPDGTRLDVHIVGIPDTLLNQLAFETQTQAYIMGRLGKTNALKTTDQKPLTRGEYKVKVYDYAQRLLTEKTYFLGGAKDATYLARLNEFHLKMRERATLEMMEIKQFATTVDSQWTLAIKEFETLSKLKGKKGIDKKWNEFHSRWLKLDEQLSQSFSKWTPDVLKNEFFYGILYELVLQAGESLQQLHALHHSYMTDAIPVEGTLQKIAELKEQVDTAVMALKNKLQSTEKLPTLPSGLPAREG